MRATCIGNSLAVRPEELAATIYHALDAPLSAPQINSGISRSITTSNVHTNVVGDELLFVGVERRDPRSAPSGPEASMPGLGGWGPGAEGDLRLAFTCVYAGLRFPRLKPWQGSPMNGADGINS